MSKTKHTPGPWFVAGDADIKGWGLERGESQPFKVAQATKSIYGAKVKKIPEYRANAALIAAAPEMYNELSNMVVEYFEAMLGGIISIDEILSNTKYYQHPATTVLLKAKGENI